RRLGAGYLWRRVRGPPFTGRAAPAPTLRGPGPFGLVRRGPLGIPAGGRGDRARGVVGRAGRVRDRAGRPHASPPPGAGRSRPLRGDRGPRGAMRGWRRGPHVVSAAASPHRGPSPARGGAGVAPVGKSRSRPLVIALRIALALLVVVALLPELSRYA